MRRFTLAAAALLSIAFASVDAAPRWALVVHGGAGVIDRNSLTPEQDAAYRAALARATESGALVLKAGGSALDAVEATIVMMEDDPLFNAGRGAVFAASGRNELDAAIMDGRSLEAGAVAGVTLTRHPISLARRVMQKSPHVLLVGPGADAFSLEQGLEQVEPGWFYTERRWRELEKALNEKALPIPAKPPRIPVEPPHDGLHPRRGQTGHRRRGGARPARQPRCRHLDGRHDRQTLGPCWRLPDHRRRHLRLQHLLCRVGHRRRRVLHSPDRRPRDLCPRAVQGHATAVRGR